MELAAILDDEVGQAMKRGVRYCEIDQIVAKARCFFEDDVSFLRYLEKSGLRLTIFGVKLILGCGG